MRDIITKKDLMRQLLHIREELEGVKEICAGQRQYILRLMPESERKELEEFEKGIKAYLEKDQMN